MAGTLQLRNSLNLLNTLLDLNRTSEGSQQTCFDAYLNMIQNKFVRFSQTAFVGMMCVENESVSK